MSHKVVHPHFCNVMSALEIYPWFVDDLNLNKNMKNYRDNHKHRDA